LFILHLRHHRRLKRTAIKPFNTNKMQPLQVA